AALCILGRPFHATGMTAVSAAGNPWVPSTPRQMRILAGNKPGSGYQGSFRGLYRTAYNFWNLLSTPEVGMTKAAEADRNRQSQELAIFHDVAKALTSSLDLDSILQTIMEKMAEYFRPDTWSLLMVDEQRDDLYFAIAVGTASEALKNVRVKVGEGIAGYVAKHGERLI